MQCRWHCHSLIINDMKSGVAMVAIVLIWDFIFMLLGLDMVCTLWDIYTFLCHII